MEKEEVNNEKATWNVRGKWMLEVVTGVVG